MGAALQHGDCRELLAAYPRNHFTACVTDPPYGISNIQRSGNHSRRFDSGDKHCISFQWKSWEPVYRTLKPGAYCLTFGHPRTYHRLTTALEDAGFEICDCLLWLHGQGMPKNRSIPSELVRTLAPLDYANLLDKWQGWGTNLRPAWEPIVVARKPMRKGYARNVLEHGVGGLNLAAVSHDTGEHAKGHNRALIRTRQATSLYPQLQAVAAKQNGKRHPTNLLLDDDTALMLDNHTRTSATEKGRRQTRLDRTLPHVMHRMFYETKMPIFGSINGYEVNPVSRFFYCMRANRKDRGVGNDHPTVKPTPLMKYLVSLVTYPGQNIILDPFCGSGSTLVAAARIAAEHALTHADITTVGMDTDAAYLRITKRRLHSLLRTAT